MDSLRWYTCFIESCCGAGGAASTSAATSASHADAGASHADAGARRALPPLLLLEMTANQEQGIGFSTGLDAVAARVLGEQAAGGRLGRLPYPTRRPPGAALRRALTAAGLPACLPFPYPAGIFDYGLKKVQGLQQLEPAIMDQLFWPAVPELPTVHPQEPAVQALRAR
jgi:hypothetical protein